MYKDLNFYKENLYQRTDINRADITLLKVENSELNFILNIFVIALFFHFFITILYMIVMEQNLSKKIKRNKYRIKQCVV